MSGEPKDIRRALRRVKPAVVVEMHYDSAGRRRRGMFSNFEVRHRVSSLLGIDVYCSRALVTGTK